MKILTRYLLGEVIGPFLFCLVACCCLWIVADLFGTLDDFLENKASLGLILQYYLTQLPRILQQMLPAILFFANLYTLLRLCRHQEFVSMQAGGAHPLFLFSPFLSIAGILSLGLLFMGVFFAGRAEMRKQQILRQLHGQPAVPTLFKGVVYRDLENRRMWFLQTVDVGTGIATGVELLQQDESGRDVVKYYAVSGRYTGTGWQLSTAKITHFQADGRLARQELKETVDLPEMTTSPLIMTTVEPVPEQMSLWQLARYLHEKWKKTPAELAPYRTQLHFLMSQSVTLLVLQLFVFPLGISPVRRSPSVGVFNAIFVLLAFLFVSHLFLAMGRGHRLSAFLAAWITPFLFFTAGLVLLGRRFGWNIYSAPLQRTWAGLRSFVPA